MISMDKLLQMNKYERAKCLYQFACQKGKRLDYEYEKMIKMVPEYACYYAMDIIRGRWKEAEEFIIKDPEWAYNYYKFVLKINIIEPEAFNYDSKSYSEYIKIKIKSTIGENYD